MPAGLTLAVITHDDEISRRAQRRVRITDGTLACDMRTPRVIRRHGTLLDLVDEAVLGIGSRPARLLLTMVGTVVGIGALVATLGLGQTAAGQITDRFDAVSATRVVVTAVPEATSAAQDDGRPPRCRSTPPIGCSGWPASRPRGTYTELDLGDGAVTGVQLVDPTAAPGRKHPGDRRPQPACWTPNSAASAPAGSSTPGTTNAADPVVVLGSGAAAALSINRVDARPDDLHRRAARSP